MTSNSAPDIKSALFIYVVIPAEVSKIMDVITVTADKQFRETQF